MISLIVFLTCLFITIAIGVMAAWSDFKGLTIPNWHSAAIIVSFFVAFGCVQVLGPDDVFSSWLSHLVSAGIVFVITILLFALKTMGAGDSKLSTAFAFWVGVAGLPAFLFYMTLTGGLLGIASIVMAKVKPIKNAPAGGWIARLQAGENKIPYGIAITCGALACFVKLGYFSEAIVLLAQS